MNRPAWWLSIGLAALLPACAGAGSATRPSAPAAGAPPAFLRGHLDQARPGLLAQVMATRGEYRGWVEKHASSPGETPATFLRAGEDRFWALRPAERWEEMPAQATRDAEVERRVREAVGQQLEDNGRRMHSGILEHHNELLRYQAELSRPPEGGWRLDGLGWLVIDAVKPDQDEAYEAQLSAAPRSGWTLVYFSSPGSGAYVHFTSGPPVLPDEALTRSRVVLPAQALPELSAIAVTR